jgi:hypothetical protein
MRLWDSHVVGSALLVQARGAQSFTSDFDFALLTGLFYPIVSHTPSDPSLGARIFLLSILNH